MSSPTTSPTQTDRSEIKQVCATVYDFGCPEIKESIEVYEIVKCPRCNDHIHPCDGEADLHEQTPTVAGFICPVPYMGGVVGHCSPPTESLSWCTTSMLRISG